nr:ribonuclease H-like domain-containing protein [Tanacetum cinerariifolium]GEZ07120.1 ribonuclease H-like domain-containing protein [Tanacetum cinerariifolium]
EFQNPEFEGYGPKTSKSVSEDIFNEVKEYLDAPLVKDMVSDNEDSSIKSSVVVEKKTIVLTVAKIEFVRAKQQENQLMMAWVPKGNYFPYMYVQGHPQKEDQGYVDKGCSRHMTGNMSYLSDFKEFDEGYVTFGRGAKRGRDIGKGTLKLVSLILRRCTLSRMWVL